jgi:hypothetical protein
MRRREDGCGRIATAPRTTERATTMRGTYRQRQELEATIIYVLEGGRRRLPIVLVLTSMRLAGLVGQHYPLAALARQPKPKHTISNSIHIHQGKAALI